MLRISYKDGWLQAETRDAAVGFYANRLTRHGMEKLWLLVWKNEDIYEPESDSIIMEWYNRTIDDERIETERLEVEEIRKARGYKTVDDLLKEDNKGVI